MSHAQKNQIVISESVQKVIEPKYECRSLGEVSLKGKDAPMPLYELVQKKPKS